MVFLPIVNAPFRFYYAYNYLRLTRTLTPPIGRMVFHSGSGKFAETIGRLQHAGGTVAANIP